MTFLWLKTLVIEILTAQTIKFRLELPDDYMVAIHLGRAGGPSAKTKLKPS